MKGLLAWSLALVVATPPCSAQQVDVSSGSVVERVAHLKAGEFVWAPQIAPHGPMLLIVNIATQRAVLFRNGVPIGASTVSTGREGRETPTGVFTILQKQVEHYSSLYDSAPMPYMQRLTWRGVALHAGKLPGYPASHGCIRLPADFAKRLYGQTSLGMTVVVTDQQVTPRVAPTPFTPTRSTASLDDAANVEWNPTKSPEGPVSILVGTADKRALVLRNGIVIGSAPVTVDGPAAETWAYALRSIDWGGQHWIRMNLAGDASESLDVAREEWGRFHAPESFRRAIATIAAPGTTVIVTPDSLSASTGLSSQTIIEAPRK